MRDAIAAPLVICTTNKKKVRAVIFCFVFFDGGSGADILFCAQYGKKYFVAKKIVLIGA